MQKPLPIGILLILVITAFPLFAQTPFSGCPGYFSILNDENGTTNSTLSTVDSATVAQTTVANTGFILNALGFNAVDNFLYAMADPALTGSPTLYRIDATGAATVLTTVNPPTGGIVGAVLSFAGDVDQAGTYYFPAIAITGVSPISFIMYLGKLDLTQSLAVPSVTPVYQTIAPDALCQSIIDAYINAYAAALILGGPLPPGGIQDWAFNPTDGQLWSYLGVEATVLSLNVTTGTATCFPTSNTPLTQFGGIFFSQGATMYGLEVDAGSTHIIDITGCPGLLCGTLTPGAAFAPDMVGDAAACPWATVLPVEWIDFSAQAMEHNVVLSWSTGQEINNSHFVIERRQEGLEFSEIGSLEGAGTSHMPQSYTFTDPGVQAGEYHYRLKQVDLNGNFAYSEIREVSMDANPSVSVRLYPNPAEDNLYLNISGQEDAAKEIQVIDMLGRFQKGQMIEKHESEITIDLSDLNTGQYLVKIRTNTGNIWKKFQVFR